MSIILTETSMLSNLRSCVGCGVNDTELGADDDIRNGTVGFRVTKTLRNKTVSVYDIVNLQYITVLGKVLDGGLGVTVVREENESNIVGLIAKISLKDHKGIKTTDSLECNIHLGGIGDCTWGNCRIFSRINGRLAMLGGNDDKRLFVYLLFNQFGNDLSERIVDEVDGPK